VIITPVLVPGGERHPGLRESVVLRGTAVERGPWLATKYAGRNPAPRAKSRRRNERFQGCSRSLKTEEGNLRPRVLRQQGAREEDPSLETSRPVQSSVAVQQPSPQVMVGLRRRPQAASRLGGSFRRRISRRACNVVEAFSEGLSRLAALVCFFVRGGP